MKKNAEKTANAAKVNTNNESTANVQVINTTTKATATEKAAKAAEERPRSLKCLANDESKLEMFSKPRALAAVKTMFDNKDSNTRKYLIGLCFSANLLKSLSADDIDTKSKSGVKFSTWETLNALKRYAEAHDLSGEQAKKQAAREEAARKAEAAARIAEKKAAKLRKDAAKAANNKAA